MLQETPRYLNAARIRRLANSKGIARERVNKRTELLLKILARRGLAATAHQQRSIHDCIELAWIERWLDRATSVASVSELLGEMWVDELLDVLRGGRPYWSARHQRAYEQGFAQGLAEGRVKAKAKTVLTILAKRGLPVTARQRRKLRECTDVATLDRWFDRAFSAASVDELLG